MIYKLSEQQYQDINDAVPLNQAFGYQDGDDYLFNTDDIVFMNYDYIEVIDTLYSQSFADFLSSLVIYKNNNADLVKFSTEDQFGTPLVVAAKPVNDFSTIVSHNFCDDSSWVSPGNSVWDLAPTENSVLVVEKAELQFENDLNVGESDIYLDYYIWHPDSVETPVLAQRITIDTARSIFELGNEHYFSTNLPEIPNGLTTVVFSYISSLSFYANYTPMQLAFLRISTKDNAVVSGSYATVSFVTYTDLL